MSAAGLIVSKKRLEELLKGVPLFRLCGCMIRSSVVLTDGPARNEVISFAAA